jgi:hypothetical protein
MMILSSLDMPCVNQNEYMMERERRIDTLAMHAGEVENERQIYNVRYEKTREPSLILPMRLIL